MNYKRLTNSDFIKRKINTCNVFRSCALCPYYRNNKFQNEDFIGGCEGYSNGYFDHHIAMEKAEYSNRLKELEDKIDSGELVDCSEIAVKILKRLLSWRSSVIFDTESVLIAEKKFEEAIKALAKEEYGVEV